MEYWEKPGRRIEEPTDSWVGYSLPIIPVFHSSNIPGLITQMPIYPENYVH